MVSRGFIYELMKMPEERVAQIVRGIRFGMNLENLRCIYCGSPNVVKFGHKTNRNGIRRYMCTHCGKVFNDLTGTPMNGSKLSLREWIVIAYLYLVREEPIFSIAKIIGRPYPTVWNAISKLKRMNGFVPHLASVLALLDFEKTAGRA